MSKFGMVFPGQGSQSVGMLSDLAKNFAIVKRIFAEASDVLGYDLWQLVQQGPAEELNKTHQTQPALLASSTAIYYVWREQNGPPPVVVAGHSLGEYSALVCAGVLDFKEAISLVELRGKLMEAAVPAGTGAMSAVIGLNDKAIAKICEYSIPVGEVFLVNFNAPGQSVIAGHKDAVEYASKACMSAGAKRVLQLQVNVPSHCVMMKSAADKLSEALQGVTFNTPQFAIISNVDAKFITAPEDIRKALVYQMYNPVRWIESVEFMEAQGIHHLLEVGPSKILTGLTKRIIATMKATAMNDSASLLAALSAVR
nr:ACP S-malonyltransferase [Candidatus Profftia tarda]